MATSRWVCLTDQEIKALIQVYVDIDTHLTNVTIPEEIKKPLDSGRKKLEKSLKRIKISSAKGKGRGLQQWVCERIARLLHIPYNQQDDQCFIHAREMGQAGVDVILRGRVREVFPFDIECKSTEKLNITSAIHQAIANQKEGSRWLLVHKSRALPEPVVTVSWETFEYLYIKGEVK
jgi:hypothetical protein